MRLCVIIVGLRVGVVARKLGDEPSPPKRQRESLQAGNQKGNKALEQFLRNAKSFFDARTRFRCA